MTTTKLSKKTIERLTKMADFLDKLKPVLFEFGTEVAYGANPPGTAYKLGGGCNTTACAVGWMPQIFPRAFKWRGFTMLSRQSEQKVSWWSTQGNVAADYLGLTAPQFVYLFSPAAKGCPLDGDATPKQVARHIRKFIAKPHAGVTVDDPLMFESKRRLYE